MSTMHVQDTRAQGVDDRISALFDGELGDDEAKRTLGRFADAESQAWAEYSLIGDVLRGCHSNRPDLGSRIRAALADEPTVLAPVPVKVAPAPRQVYWMAAAAAVTAIAWTVLSLAPPVETNAPVPVAAAGIPVAQAANSAVQAYLDAHQDYAYAVVAEPDMRYSQVSLAEERQ
ncbi:MAG: sigma-E factor negative regulatory protein [Pseudomonadota bacterium]